MAALLSLLFVTATAAGLALALKFDLDITPVMAVALGALMGVAGQLGDLFESWIKRSA